MEEGKSEEKNDITSNELANVGSQVQAEQMSGMELEHMIGFSPVPSGLIHHQSPDKFLHACGASVVVADIVDAHNQTFLFGHDAFISCLASSPSGKYCATGQHGKPNSDICLWELNEEENFVLKHRFYMHQESSTIVSLSFSRDERLLYSIGSDSQFFIWDINTGNYITYDKSALYQTASCIAAGGKWKDVKNRDTKVYQCAIGLTDRNMKAGIFVLKIDPYKGEVSRHTISLIKERREYTALDFSPDGNLLFGATSTGDFVVAHKQKIKQEFALLTYVNVCRLGVLSIKCMPSFDDKFVVVTGGGDGTVCVWRDYLSGNGKLDFESCFKAQVRGGVLALSTAQWMTQDGTKICEGLAGTDDGYVYRLNFTNVVNKNAAKESLPPLRLLQSHTGAVTHVNFAANVNENFVSCSEDGSVKIWNALDYSLKSESRVTKSNMFPTCAAATADGAIVVSGWSDGRVRAYLSEPDDRRRQGGKDLAWEINDVSTKGGVSDLILSHNERFFVTGDHDGMVRVWGYSGHELVSQLKQHMDKITGFALFDDDVHLLSCSKDKSFYCWDLRHEKAISWHTQRMGAVLGIALSHDQTQVLTVGTDSNITYWDLRQPSAIQVVKGAHTGDVTSIAISHDGKRIATGGSDHVVKLWDFTSASKITEGYGHSATINKLAFSPDDKQLLSAGADGNTCVWNVYS